MAMETICDEPLRNRHITGSTWNVYFIMACPIDSQCPPTFFNELFGNNLPTLNYYTNFFF